MPPCVGTAAQSRQFAVSVRPRRGYRGAVSSHSGDMLVAAPEHWDEACFGIPAVRALMASGLGVGVLCPAKQVPLWETLDGLQVVGFPENARPRAVAAGLGAWKASLAWLPGFAADVFNRAKIPRRLGRDDRHLNRRLTHPLPIAVKPEPVQHRVAEYLAIIEALGIPTARPEFYAPVNLGIAQEPATVLLCPDSDYGASYEWPLDRWFALAEALAADGVMITVAGLPNGRGLGQALAHKLSGDTPFFEAEPLGETLPLLAVHSVVVAADGSLPHLASHVGAVCVTLFGPNDPTWRRPLGRRHSVARRHVECAPCFKPRCPLDLRCQLELDGALVLELVRRALARQPASALP
jgi:ADP-heptose:LPS heptosyltransferase